MPDKVKDFLRQNQGCRIVNSSDKKRLRKRIWNSSVGFLVGVVVSVILLMLVKGQNPQEIWASFFVIGLLLAVLGVVLVRDFTKIRLSAWEKEDYVVGAYVLNMLPSRGGKRICAAYYDHLQREFLATSFLLNSAEGRNIRNGDVISIVVTEREGKLEYVGVIHQTLST